MIKEYIVRITDSVEQPDAFARFEDDYAPEQELVRCKDCKYASIYGQTDIFSKPLCDCEHPNNRNCEYHCNIHHLEWFCANGERR